MCVCVCVCACVYACGCLYVCMWVSTGICVYVNVYVCMCVCVRLGSGGLILNNRDPWPNPTRKPLTLILTEVPSENLRPPMASISSMNITHGAWSRAYPRGGQDIIIRRSYWLPRALPTHPRWQTTSIMRKYDHSDPIQR